MSSPDPSVSVVVIFLNAERFLGEAIESVLAQTIDDWELLLVDDGSTDGSTAIARELEGRDARIRYVEHPHHENRGMSASRNLGIRGARGRYVAMLDSDDVWFPGKLEEQVAIFDAHPEVSLVFGASEYWYSWTGKPEDRNRDQVIRPGISPETVIEPPKLTTSAYPLGGASAPCVSSLIFRRDAAVRLGGFEESFRGIYQLFEDQCFLAKMYLNERIYVGEKCWDRYRQHPQSCMSAALRDRTYDRVRQRFLSWLARYVSRCRVTDASVLSALARARVPYRRSAARAIRAIVRRLRPVEARHVRVLGPAEGLRGSSIDSPRAGDRLYDGKLTIEGWVLGFDGPAAAVEVFAGEKTVARTVPDLARIDVAAACPEVPRAERSGFRIVLELPVRGSADYRVGTVLSDGQRVRFGEISIRRFSRRRTGGPVEPSSSADRWPPPVGRVRFGDFRSAAPVSREFGFDRGTPIDRFYVEKFLAKNAEWIRGRVLEIGDDTYSRKFGANRVTRQDVLHVREGSPGATVIGDLSAAAPHLGSDVFDCVILTQTLQFIFDVRAALATVHRILKPGGVLLATVPGISQIAGDEWGTRCCWSFTELSVRRLAGETFPRSRIAVGTYGSVLTAVAFLEGLAAEELTARDLAHTDEKYQLLISLLAIKDRE